MENVKVSIDRIVVDFTNVYWAFFNPFRQRICEFYGAGMYLQEKGFKYHVQIRDNGHYLHIAYQLVIAPKSRKHTLRIEAHPDSLVHFKSWLSNIKRSSKEVYFVRCDVAFDIPCHLADLFTMSLTGRKLTMYKGTRYYNKTYQRQQDGYCRVYDKKNELWENHRQEIRGELTRMEIVYAPKGKVLLHSLVQYPPQFNKLYQCALLTDQTLMKTKTWQKIQAIVKGELLPQDLTYYHRKQIQEAIRTQRVIDLDTLAAERWEEVITLSCAVLGGFVNKVAQ